MRRTIGIVTGLCLTSLAFADRVLAQQYGPPPQYPAPQAPVAPQGYPPGAAPGPYGPPVYNAPGQPGQPAPSAPVYPGPAAPGAAPTYAPQGPPGAPANPGYGAGAAGSASGSYSFGGQAPSRGDVLPGGADATTEPTSDEVGLAERRESLKLENAIDGSTGLLRNYAAGSGATGTFRFSLLSSYFSGSHFLCPKCATTGGGADTQSDSATHISGHVGISATPASFLEAYLAVHTSASSNSLGTPRLLQVLGDTDIGVKAFMPHETDQIFSAGGSAELWLLNGTGAVGIDKASFGLRGLATADFNNRKSKDDRIPLRLHLNIGYLFDNSGKLVEDVEKNLGHKITRIERFGLNINRVDTVRVGLGVEIPIDIVQPFAEWTVDVPVNRQGHVCALSERAAGDQCLGSDARFSAWPSRLTFGGRLKPFSGGLEGLSFLAALDIGTGATSNFIEEVVPEMPWDLFFGVAFAADTEPRVEIRHVETPKLVAAPLPEVHHFILGTVVEKGSGVPVPDALVRFDGRNLTGMIAASDGTFRTSDLDPGTYTFNVSATGYRDGQCNATIPFGGGQQPGYPGQAGSPYPGQPAASPYPGQAPYPGQPAASQYPGAAPGPYSPAPYGAPQPGMPGQPGALPGTPTATVTCEVESLPKVGNVNGQLRDADTGSPVGSADVKITDKLNRSLSLTADSGGSFRFENVPPGPVTISAESQGYLRSVIGLEVKPHEDVTAQVTLTKRPRQPNVVVTGTELKLKKAVHFQHDSSEILPDSMGILEEIADALSKHAEIASVEIQGHTDDSGTPAYNLRLSGERANAVREALVMNGVEQNRLTAHGYGQEKPLVPNTNEANRAKNRRVQLMIQK